MFAMYHFQSNFLLETWKFILKYDNLHLKMIILTQNRQFLKQLLKISVVWKKCSILEEKLWILTVSHRWREYSLFSIFWRFSILVCMYMCMNMPNPQKAQSPITPDENPKCVNPIYNSDPCRAVNPFLA